MMFQTIMHVLRAGSDTWITNLFIHSLLHACQSSRKYNLQAMDYCGNWGEHSSLTLGVLRFASTSMFLGLRLLILHSGGCFEYANKQFIRRHNYTTAAGTA